MISYMDRNVFQRMMTDQEFRIYMETKLAVGFKLGTATGGMTTLMGGTWRIDSFIENNRVKLGWFVSTMNAYEKLGK